MAATQARRLRWVRGIAALGGALLVLLPAVAARAAEEEEPAGEAVQAATGPLSKLEVRD